MAEKILMKGNEAIGEAAIKAGCQCFFWLPDNPADRSCGLYVKNDA
jgi:2-oxoglutarate ferredoxin oxidoreductase subunit alpha